MTQPILLSILIPTVVGREDECHELELTIDKQAYNRKVDVFDKWGDVIRREWDLLTFVETIIYKDDKKISIGEKRERLYSLANGTYSFMIDDDDSIAPNAIELILNAIKNNPEIPCITFREKCMMNGIYKSSNHSIRYSQWMDNQDGFDYVRSPFYKDVIRTDIARSVPFPHIRYNEDEQWSKALKPFLTDEIHIDEELYHYIYNETNHNERYGLDRE